MGCKSLSGEDNGFTGVVFVVMWSKEAAQSALVDSQPMVDNVRLNVSLYESTFLDADEPLPSFAEVVESGETLSF